MLRFVDHLVYSTPDLDDGIHLVEQLFGTDIVAGGRHENWGTKNALVSLGEASYLEIIGPDPEQSIHQTPRLFNIDRIDRPRLVTWAAKGRNLTDIVASARNAGIDLGDVSHGTRVLANGTMLRWQLTDPYADRMGGIIPFFIDWGDTAHPAAALPTLCNLIAVDLGHPQAQEAKLAMKAVGITTQVVTADTPRIRATIRTPNGIVELT
jgi:hypothetical protein